MLLLADVHAHAYQGSKILANGRNKRLQDVIACLDQALCVTRKGTSLVIAGDLFHTRKGVLPEVLQAVGEWLNRAQSVRVPVYILAGNHDLSIGGDGSASVVALRHAHIITEACRLEIDGHMVGFVPYAEDPEYVRSIAKTHAKAGATVLVAHLGLGDPRFADCIPVDYEVPGHINLDDLRGDDFEQVFLGHYHNPQELASNVRYIGSPLQLSFREAGQAKGFVQFDNGKVKRIENDWSPKFLKMDAAQAVAQLAHGEIAATDFVWVTGCTREDAKDLRAGAEATGMTIRVEHEHPVHHKIRIDASAGDADMLHQYVRATTPEAPNAEARQLIDTGLQLLTQAVQESQ